MSARHGTRGKRQIKTTYMGLVQFFAWIMNPCPNRALFLLPAMPEIVQYWGRGIPVITFDKYFEKQKNKTNKNKQNKHKTQKPITPNVSQILPEVCPNYLFKKSCWAQCPPPTPISYAVADPSGAQQAPPPPKIGSTMFCVFIQLFIRMLKNKAQIAQESIKTTLELPGPLSGPWTPAESEFGSALIMCVWAHNLLCPPPQMKILDPPLHMRIKYSQIV